MSTDREIFLIFFLYYIEKKGIHEDFRDVPPRLMAGGEAFGNEEGKRLPADGHMKISVHHR